MGGRVVLEVNDVPESVGCYLAGFADGEGSFNVTFRKRAYHGPRWKVSLCFNVSQRDPTVLALFKETLRCGTMRTRSDGVWYFEVNDFASIKLSVIPFFKRFAFLSAKKQRDFHKFVEIAGLISRGEHLAEAGIRRILEIRASMNDGGVGRRKYSDADILDMIARGKSSETTRQATTIREPVAAYAVGGG